MSMSLSSLLRGSSIYMLYTHMAPCIIERYIQVIVVVQCDMRDSFASFFLSGLLSSLSIMNYSKENMKG